MGNGIIFTQFENFARCLKIWNDYNRKKNHNGGAVSKFMLILKTYKLFAILFHEYISLCIKHLNIRVDFEKCVFITDINMYVQHI